jgi:hypothetical protein
MILIQHQQIYIMQLIQVQLVMQIYNQVPLRMHVMLHLNYVKKHIHIQIIQIIIHQLVLIQLQAINLMFVP